MDNRIWRQGDLLFEKVDKIPSGFIPSRSNIILRGEATGHSHKLENGTLFDRERYGISNRELLSMRREVYISVQKGGRIVHEEHATLILPWGFYKVIYQREYSEPQRTPAGWMWVGD